MTFRKTLLSEVMNPAPITITPDIPLAEAAACMLESDRSCLVVELDDAAKGWGILTQKDVLAAMADVGASLEGLRVSDVMTHPSVTLPPSYDIGTSIQLMRMLGVRRAAVVEGPNLVGFVSFTDLFRHALQGQASAAN
jgi:CBS domain-containing protein